MKEPYLEVTYRHGRPLAAYYYLPRRPRERSHRSRRASSGLVVDYSRGGRPIGIEITAPARASLAAINRLLKELGQRAMTQDEISPLLAA